MTVFLVGAGPGDPGLLTVRGAEVLAMADVVVHDRLAEVSLLDLAPPGAERIDVGKSPGSPAGQDEINDLLVERGRTGESVVRLKGGDPFVFGRGGEEAMALRDAGVDFEVVPGVSAAIAVPAYAGIPVTHRGLSTSFTVVTGHSRHAVDTETDWASLARCGDTLVVLMGVAHRGEIAARLMAGGLDPRTPVAAVQWGTRPGQRTQRTVLADLAEAPLEPPATIVIGRVAALDLAWFDRRPLFARRVVVTRSRAQASDLVVRLRALGAEVTELATVALAGAGDGGAALAQAAQHAGSYDWVVFSSANAVEQFWNHLRDARSLGSARVAAVGPATAAALSVRGVVADLVPAGDAAMAEGLLDAFPPPGDETGRSPRVLLPQADGARPVLADGLRRMGWEVDVVEAYRTVGCRPPNSALAAAAEAEAITFTSSSTVTNYLDVAGPQSVPPLVVCIGPVTAATARDRGLTVDAVATEHTIDGLVDALVKTFRSMKG